MPDPIAVTNTDLGIAAGLGTVGGLLGAAVTALFEDLPRKQLFAAILGGMGFGSSTPMLLVIYLGVHPLLSVGIGFATGLSVIGLIAGFKKIGTIFGINPGAFTSMSGIKDALKHSPTDSAKGGDK